MICCCVDVLCSVFLVFTRAGHIGDGAPQESSASAEDRAANSPRPRLHAPGSFKDKDLKDFKRLRDIYLDISSQNKRIHKVYRRYKI